MSSKPRGANSDHEYLRAAITERKHCEDEHNVVVYTAISFGDRLGVLVVRSEVREVGQSLQAKPLCAYQGEWPNAQVVGWTAFLFQHYVKVTRLTEDSRRDEAAFWEGTKQAV